MTDGHITHATTTARFGEHAAEGAGGDRIHHIEEGNNGHEIERQLHGQNITSLFVKLVHDDDQSFSCMIYDAHS